MAVFYVIEKPTQSIAYLDEQGYPSKARLDTYLLTDLQIDLESSPPKIYGAVVLTYRLDGKPVRPHAKDNRHRCYFDLDTVPVVMTPWNILRTAVTRNEILPHDPE